MKLISILWAGLFLSFAWTAGADKRRLDKRSFEKIAVDDKRVAERIDIGVLNQMEVSLCYDVMTYERVLRGGGVDLFDLYYDRHGVKFEHKANQMIKEISEYSKECIASNRDKVVALYNTTDWDRIIQDCALKKAEDSCDRVWF